MVKQVRDTRLISLQPPLCLIIKMIKMWSSASTNSSSLFHDHIPYRSLYAHIQSFMQSQIVFQHFDPHRDIFFLEINMHNGALLLPGITRAHIHGNT